MISSVASYSISQAGTPSTTKASAASSVSSEQTGDQSVSTQNKSTATISTLASQLAASASRAEERDSSLSRSELGEKAKRLLDRISGDLYQLNKAQHDSEVPKTDNPELLARAKQATAFLNDADRGGHSVKNPFAGLSRDQLANIIYDDSGTFTVNEQRAAWYESYDQELVWRKQVAAKAMEEYNKTGKLTNFFQEVLDHFKSLPVIEQAQYPNDYASDLESKIATDFNYKTNQAEGQGNTLQSLIDTVLKQSPSKDSDAPTQEDKNN
jgi:hypothetical protein